MHRMQVPSPRKMNLCHPFNSSSPDGATYHVVKGTVVISRQHLRSPPGRKTTICLYSSTQFDKNRKKARLSKSASLKNRKKTKHGKTDTFTYHITFHLDMEFGLPGAIVVKNGNKTEFFLKFVSLEVSEDRKIHFDCNSWVYPVKKTNTDRLFFSNTSYLPGKTPLPLQDLRKEELLSLRGNGRGERKTWDRIYDYEYYNDLGSPDKGEDRARPVLGGTTLYPYPRRCRTGRPVSAADGVTETRGNFLNLDYYVPPDDRFSPVKFSEFITSAIQAVIHFVIPEVKSLFQGDINNFRSFEQLKRDLYAEPRHSAAFEMMAMEKLKTIVPDEVYKDVTKSIKKNPAKFPVPQVIAADENAWRTDEEFAREMLAGLNPAVIKCLKVFPPVGVGGRESSITDSHIEGKLEGLTIQRAMDQKRIFILDHHDYLMPYLSRINSQKGVRVYASRTLLFLKDDGTLKPLAIELTLPGEEEQSRVFVPDIPVRALWELAKTFVAVNDSGYHQLISHWLYTHAAVEPFVIATKRQLSAMHPIYKLLDPHFKDTMHINALARSILLNSGGILERTMFPGKYAMELSSKIYTNWRFTEQALPEDLVKRGLAVRDFTQPSGVSLLLEDYPYATDGLDIWVCIKKWVHNYCVRFYPDDMAVISDPELELWYTEIRHVGHGDRREDPHCWLELNSIENLAQTLTTLIWIASALHASVNFGQFAYAGFAPNRPTRCREFIPVENTHEFAELQKDPEKFFFHMVPDRFTTTLGLALIEVLSCHMSDEVYLGQRASAGWTDDGEVLRLFEEFTDDLRRVEKNIKERNKDALLKNRLGPAKVPYTLMYPDTSNTSGKDKGVTGKGIPNSVSI
ncbi:Lipoxygenase [Rhynchospora pubera]|uniref:Lipoxygenase n=1 Tax=Rhynchospora pubera TaxID=906938 RepID=A0AAV8CPK9_9POAL|nr:Lipoxygenase [Rhynchospora pubera]